MAANPIQRHILRTVSERGGWGPIVDRIASGETVAQIAKDFHRPDGIPISRAFFSILLHKDPERSKRVYEARTEGAAAMVDHALTLVDAAPADRDSVNKAKVQAETRLKIAGLIDRPNWGEQKQQLNVQVNVADLHLDALRTRQLGAGAVIREMTEGRVRQIAADVARARETTLSPLEATPTRDSSGDS